MNRALWRASLGLWLGASAGLIQTMPAQTGPVLEARMYTGIMVAGTVSATYTIEATTNLSDPHGWVAWTNVVLPTSPWVYIDYASPGMAKRFYRARGVNTNSPSDTNAPAGMVFIPAGTFVMGSPSTEPDRDSDEGPQTQVTISQGFWMSKYETTQEEYLSVMGNNPAYFTGDLKRPVEQVIWYDATNYCGKLTAKERAAGRLPAGYEYRLPTEAEWEYACRAGTTTRYSFGDDPNYSQLGDYAWYVANSGGQTHPVGQKKPNVWGLYDLHGNVWEWCSDWYGTYPGGSVTDPRGPNTGSFRVDRGGGWYDSGRRCRTAYRRSDWADYGYGGMGFRSVLAQGQK